ncbi:hypothetical protein SGLAM104S_09597 [Streptomyces glaucescens]
MPSPSTTAATSRTGASAPGPRTAGRPAPALFLTLLAVCSAVTAANIYLAAPLLTLMARTSAPRPPPWPGSPRSRSSATRSACCSSPRSATP